jgi:hypothetical protein
MKEYPDIKTLQRITETRRSQTVNAVAQCDHEIKHYTIDRREKLKNELKKIDQVYDQSMREVIDKILQEMVYRVELYNTKKQHTKDEHKLMIEELDLNHELSSYYLGIKSETITKANEVLSNLYDSHHQHWRKIFGAKVKLQEPVTHFLRSTHIPLLLETLK